MKLRKAWSPEEKALLAALFAQGWLVRDVAAKLGRSPLACASMAGKLGVPVRWKKQRSGKGATVRRPFPVVASSVQREWNTTPSRGRDMNVPT